jgi:DNA-binding PadR family transcriptional regulator
VISFLRPCLMVLLHRGEAHGYSLLSELGQFGFDSEQLDPSLVYRALREMEAEQLVVSDWAEESLGPQRRVYRITPQGEAHLADWIEDLRRARQEIDRLLQAYQQMEHVMESTGDLRASQVGAQ